MADVAGPALNRSRLRSELRRAREGRGLTQREAAAVAEWSISKLLRIESGQVGVSIPDIRHLSGIYSAEPERLHEWLELARHSRRQSWAGYGDVITPDFRTYLGLEEESSTLRVYESAQVPALLQTAEYAKALVTLHAQPEAGAKDLERRVTARMDRQRLLTSPDRPAMFFVVDESVLRRRVGAGRSGSAALMRDQLRKLLQVSCRPTISLQVLPFDAGEHRGMTLRSFVCLSFDGPTDADMAFVDRPAIFWESAAGDDTEPVPSAQIGVYMATFDELSSLALDVTDSLALVRFLLDREERRLRERPGMPVP